ncbi:hypothetical protein AURDEDRAFT_173320 [Auricularia subglabra TFB-10046 SS5]|uniref:Uncharacterized protein n=1 Tax=Auricularia subglabra (strain TFB-10046 / SS5) TaxID=717982 RepID=J0WUN9_AURST|nr:hypothetical protein AURDEDRAFT_173320 [Auricularia subglabra TFB-10046 SS5]
MLTHRLFSSTSILALSGRLFASARVQATVYDAGTSYWETDGHAVAVPLSSLRSFCSVPSALPEEDGLQAFILSSPTDIVSLRFNGTALTILGITFAYNSCDEGLNPVDASLEVAPPPPSSPPPPPAGHPEPSPPLPGCIDYPVPVADCNIELSQWTGLDSNNRHRPTMVLLSFLPRRPPPAIPRLKRSPLRPHRLLLSRLRVVDVPVCLLTRRQARNDLLIRLLPRRQHPIREIDPARVRRLNAIPNV